MPTFLERVEFPGVVVIEETPLALLCRFPEDQDCVELWIPQSQIDDDSEVYEDGGEGVLIISEWIAAKKGLL